jgi:hypothetical protein
MRSFYRILGNTPTVCEAHNVILDPKALEFDADYLIFMEENQSVVSWGVRRVDLAIADPPTWQRNNTEPLEWFPEDKSFTELLMSMFEWYTANRVWPS